MVEITIMPGVPEHQSYRRALRVVFQTADGRRGTVMYHGSMIRDWRNQLENRLRCRITILSTAPVDIGIDMANPTKESIGG